MTLLCNTLRCCWRLREISELQVFPVPLLYSYLPPDGRPYLPSEPAVDLEKAACPSVEAELIKR